MDQNPFLVEKLALSVKGLRKMDRKRVRRGNSIINRRQSLIDKTLKNSLRVSSED